MGIPIAYAVFQPSPTASGSSHHAPCCLLLQRAMQSNAVHSYFLGSLTARYVWPPYRAALHRQQLMSTAF